MKFFQFTQNTTESAVGFEHVIIQAENVMSANDRAVESDLNIYFYGVQAGIDCSCCGDRWSTQWIDDEGTDVPQVWSDVLSLTDIPENNFAVILFADGTRKFSNGGMHF